MSIAFTPTSDGGRRLEGHTAYGDFLIVDGIVELWEPRTPDQPAHQPPAPTAIDECQHRGAEIERRPCKTCSGTVSVKVFECSLHGACSLTRPVGVNVCAGCPDRVSP